MPNCFSLTRKSDLEAGPVVLQVIDEEMCKHFGVPCDPKIYHAYWYQTIGFSLACGKTFEDIRDDVRSQIANATDILHNLQDLHQIAICDWLEANFTTNAWAERR